MISEFSIETKKNANSNEIFRPIFYTTTSELTADKLEIKKKLVTKINPFFHYWTIIGYYGLCIPFKSSLELNSRSYILKTNKFQKVKITEYYYQKQFLGICVIINLSNVTAHLPFGDMEFDLLLDHTEPYTSKIWEHNFKNYHSP